MSPEDAEKIIRANWPPENYSMLREALDAVLAQATQISALKDKLVEERAKILMADEDEVAEAWEYLKDNPRFANEARQHLKADLDLQKAGVEWE